MKNHHLVIAFSTKLQYPPRHLHRIVSKTDHVDVISGFDYCNSEWRVSTLTARLLRFLKGRAFFRQSGWISAKEMREYLKSSFSVNVKLLTPNFTRRTIGYLASFRFFLGDVFWLRDILSGVKAPLFFEDNEVSAYVTDSLMRYQSGFDIHRGPTIVNFIMGMAYVARARTYHAWFVGLIHRKQYNHIIINHNVYCESGLLGMVCNEKGMSVIHVNAQQRDPLLLTSYREHWRWSLLNGGSQALTQERDSGGFANQKLPHFEQAAIMYSDGARVLKVDSSIKLIVMHAFTDANNIHYESQSADFPTYFEWICYTLRIAELDAASQYVFRMHPSTKKYYKKDPKIVRHLFEKTPKNVILEDPDECDARELYPISPLVVTFKGSVALESALLGMRAITLGQAVCPPQCMWEMTSRVMYRDVLLGKQTNRLLLDDAEIRLAQSWKHQLNHALRVG